MSAAIVRAWRAIGSMNRLAWPLTRDAVAHGVDAFVAGAQGVWVHRDAVVPGQAGALRQPPGRLQAGGGNHLVRSKVLATFGGDRGTGHPPAAHAFHRSYLHTPHEADRQVLPRLQHPCAGLLVVPARQRLGLHVQQGDAVAAQRQVVGQLAADQACADDQHVLGCVAQRRFAQLQVGAQVVDAPAQRRGQ
jgi:hypothetical protein